jgi:hypothetical protein
VGAGALAEARAEAINAKKLGIFWVRVNEWLHFPLSAMYFLPPQYDVCVVPAGWEWQKAESTLTLAESGAVILP